MQANADNRALDLRRTRSAGALPIPETSFVTRPVRVHLPNVPADASASTNPQLNPNRTHQQAANNSLDGHPGLVGKILVLLGYAGPGAKARRALISLIFSLFWWFAQFAVIIALLAYSSVHKSPTAPEFTEWAACDRALGPWNVIWIVRTMLGATLAFWLWKRGRAADRLREQSNDTEAATQRDQNGQPNLLPASRNTLPRQHPRRNTGLSSEGSNGTNTANSQALSPSRFYPVISLLTSLLTLAWFLSAHVLEYTSINTCRLSSPHIWWLTFGILCTLYLEILEIIGLGLLVCVIGPIVYLVYNITLLCLGRHPLQNPHYFKPDIDKLSKTLVDQIPLVLYIPPPPEESPTSITVPPPTHAYPPKSPTSPTSPSSTSTPTTLPKRRFAWFRRKSKGAKAKDKAKDKRGPSDSDVEKNAAGGEAEAEEDVDVPWDEMWEKGEYPFVRLEGNRAVCAICLMDFEEPKRVRGVKAASGPGPLPAPSSPTAGAEGGHGKKEGETSVSGGGDGAQVTQEIRVEAVSEEEREALRLDDAGEGAQPLRLLSCGHVFHQTCVDPWLTNVSGRCPVCQRPVEIPESKKKSKRRSRRT